MARLGDTTEERSTCEWKPDSGSTPASAAATTATGREAGRPGGSGGRPQVRPGRLWKEATSNVHVETMLQYFFVSTE